MEDKRTIEQMDTLEVYSNGINLLEWIVNVHVGDKRKLKKDLHMVIHAIRMTAFKKSFPDLAHMVPNDKGEFPDAH